MNNVLNGYGFVNPLSFAHSVFFWAPLKVGNADE